FIFLFIFLILINLSCSKKEKQELKILTVAISSNPTNLDARFASDMASQYITNQIYRSLIFINDKLDIEYDLAKSIEIIDSQVYVITIDSNVFFSNNKKLTADDVKFTYETIVDSESKSPYKKSFDYLDKIELIDDYKIKFELKRPYAPFLSCLTIGIVPEKLANLTQEEFSRKPIGAGPFEIVEWLADEKITLKKNEYYNKQKIDIDKIIFKILPDDNTRYLEIVKGSIDVSVNNIPQDMINQIQNNPKLKILTSNGVNYSYLGFNCEHKILKDKRVRQAIAYAINRDEIIKNILNGFAIKATNILIPENWANEPEVKKYEYDPETSKKLLDEAGYKIKKNGIRFTLEYKALNKDITRRIAEVIQAQLKQINIDVQIKMYEWGTFYGDVVKGNFEMFQLTWVGVTEPDIYYMVFHSSNIPPNGANRGRYKNPIIDKLVEEARYELNIEKRKKIYSEIQKIIAEDEPYVSLWYNSNICILNNRIKNYKLHPTGNLKYLAFTQF
ncbi:MAG TPA: ABC transporter substrate-binding protein, partial [bacterium]|nr:ABC transporter substrate-binding protein [bacterium]